MTVPALSPVMYLDGDLEVRDAPTDLAGAERLLVELGEVEAEIAAIEASAAAFIDPIAKRRDALKAAAQRRANFKRLGLEEYAKLHRSDIVRGGKKSRDLIAGTIGFRSKSERLVVVDRPALIAWLETQPDPSLYRVKVEPEMAKLQALFRTTGVLPPGCDMEPESETVHIETFALPQLENKP